MTAQILMFWRTKNLAEQKNTIIKN